jgi:uncharacterized protein (TIGR00725 family)
VTHLVAVIGKGRRCPPAVYQLAVQCGEQLARLHPDVALICGGLGGVMSGAARGITQAGGVSIGLVPHGHAPGPYLTYGIRLGLPENFRNVALAHAAELVVCLPGSHGTAIEGWAAVDYGRPLLAVGPHERGATSVLPFTCHTSVPELARVAGQLLHLPRR